jgi:VWFA-related protein
MRLTHVLIACAISICPALAAQNQPDQASGQPIQVFITASHKNGLPVSLTTTDIAVSIDKKTAQVTDVRSAKDDPLLFALLVDVSKSDGEEAKTIRELGVQLFKALAVGQNRGYLVLFNDNVAMSQTPMSAERAELNLNTVKFDRSTALYDAIAQTSTYKFGAPENAKNMRRVIVLISDGEDNSSHIPHTKAEEAAQKQHVAIFPVLIPSTFTGPVSRGPERMNDFSRATGGRLVKADKVPETVQSLLSALREQWLISLVSAEATYKKTLTLQVKSEAKDIKILAPSQIFLP